MIIDKYGRWKRLKSPGYNFPAGEYIPAWLWSLACEETALASDLRCDHTPEDAYVYFEKVVRKLQQRYQIASKWLTFNADVAQWQSCGFPIH